MVLFDAWNNRISRHFFILYKRLPLILILIIAMAFFYTSAVAQWEKISPQSEVLYGSHRLISPENTDVYYALGVQMVTSNDAGVTWTISGDNGLAVNEDLLPISVAYDLDFPGVETGYLVKRNRIYKTVDGNLSWTLQLELDPKNSLSDSPYFNAVDFANDNVGLAVGTYNKIFKTVNGGDTWEELSWTASITPFVSYTDVIFLTPSVGYVAGYQAPDRWTNFAFQYIIKKTSDGGATWTTETLSFTQDHREPRLQFLDEQTGYLALTRSQSLSDRLFKTEDGGENWNEVSVPAAFRQNDMEWVTVNKGFMIGNENSSGEDILLTTTDGGLNWEASFVGEGLSLENITFNSTENGVISGRGGELLITQDGGATWETRFRPSLQFRATAVRDNEIFSLSDKGLVHSTNNGLNWSVINDSSPFNAMTHIEVLSNGELVFLPFFWGIVYLSTDGGKTISPVSSMLINSGASPMAIIENRIFYAGTEPSSRQLLLRVSTDLGLNWQENAVGTTESATAMSVIDDQSIVISTPRNIHRSVDGGQTWEVISTFPQEVVIIRSQFTSAEAGLVVLEPAGQVLRTMDGGGHWEEVTFSPDKVVEINEFLFLDNNVGYASGAARETHEIVGLAAIWRTDDGGKTWKEEVIPEGIYTNLIDLTVSGSEIFATGGYGHMLKRSVAAAVQEPPVVVNPIQDRVVNEGFERETVDLTGVFGDPNGDALRFSVISSDESIATAVINDHSLVLTEQGIGTVRITVTASDGFGGSVDNAFKMLINANETITDIDDVLNNPAIKVFPNPVLDKLNIHSDHFAEGDPAFNFMDAMGRSISFSIYQKASGKYVLYTGDLKKGVYLLEILCPGMRVVRRVVKF